ncbi:MAG: ABC transporter ATP-binding protein [Nanoarchaeota archaeon]
MGNKEKGSKGERGSWKDYPTKRFVKDIAYFLKGHKSIFAFAMFVRLISELGSYAIPFLIGEIIDVFTEYQKTGAPFTNFYYILVGIAVIGVVQVWMRTYSKTYIGVAGAKARQNARQLAINKLMDLELEWHEHEDTGSKIQRVNAGSNYIYRFFSSFLSNNGTVVFTGIFVSIFLFILIGWKYALFAFVYATIYLVVENHFNKQQAYWTDKLNKIDEKISGKIHESASNVLSVKSLGLKGIFRNASEKRENEYYNIWYNAKTSSHNKLRYTKSFGAIGYALFVLLVGLDFVNGLVSLGSILVYAAYFNKLRDSLDKMSDASVEYIQTKSAVGRLMTILGRDVFDRESSDLLEIPKDWKEIRFENVYFDYKGASVLRDFNLVINRGENIGLVGKSGCGKSTLIKLLLGLYKPKQGKILIDNTDIEKFKHSSITNTLTAVLQDSEMFDMSLEENITISALHKDADILRKSIEVSALKEVIKKLPKGLKTIIGEKGYKLSGGERQRIGIARAVYKDTNVILLDEATSHLDSKTEQLIQGGLESETKKKTLILVAHRLSTLKNADRIYFMEKGKIVESGNFDELVRKKGKFYELYKIQSRKKMT